MFRTLFAMYVLLASAISCMAQPGKGDAAPLRIGDIVTLRSAVLDEDRILNVYLPEGYHASPDSVYPVICLLDGSMNEDFVHVVGLVQFFQLMFGMPPTIVVGVANVDRKRDFTFPTSLPDMKEKYPTTGGSAAFISFLDEELLPYIAAHYRVNDRRILIGQSLGGLLAAEVLLRKPALFDTYIIVSPSMWWDNESLLAAAPALIAGQPDRPLHVIVSVGDEGKIMKRGAKGLYKALQRSGKAQMTSVFLPVMDENHATILHSSIYRALKLMYPYKE